MHHSDVIQLKSTCLEDNIGTLDIFPNPVQKNDLSARLYSNINESAKVVIISVAGEVIIQKDIEVVEGINQIDLQIPELTTGTYFMHIQGKGWRSSFEKFVKIK